MVAGFGYRHPEQREGSLRRVIQFWISGFGLKFLISLALETVSQSAKAR